MTTDMNPSSQSLTPEVRRRLFAMGGIAAGILIIAAVAAYLISSHREISITSSSISAPLIALSPSASGRLNAVYVNPGDTVTPGTPVALVGTEVLQAKVTGLIVAVNDTVGAQVAPSEGVVTMIDPSQLRVVGKIDENKGLSRIEVGDPVTFTVDAYGSRQFKGIVDEVAPTANQSGIVFNISSQREVQQFDVKARFDTSAYPFLKNGMSARMYVYPTQ
jgi:multidrug resistance efflux pump